MEAKKKSLFAISSLALALGLMVAPAVFAGGGDRGDGHRGDRHRGDGHRGDRHRGDGHRGDRHRGDGHRRGSINFSNDDDRRFRGDDGRWYRYGGYEWDKD